MKISEIRQANCNSCFRFSHYALEIQINSNTIYLCGSCADDLKDELKELREE